MPDGAEIRGAYRFQVVGRQLKAAGLEGRGLKRELLREIRVAAAPMAQAAKQAAAEELPKSGGMNEYYASGRFSVRNRLTGNAGVRIVATKAGHSMRQADSGRVKHPPWGHRDRKWTYTKTKRGWFEDALTGHKPVVQAAVLRAIQATTAKIGR